MLLYMLREKDHEEELQEEYQRELLQLEEISMETHMFLMHIQRRTQLYVVEEDTRHFPKSLFLDQ